MVFKAIQWMKEEYTYKLTCIHLRLRIQFKSKIGVPKLKLGVPFTLTYPHYRCTLFNVFTNVGSNQWALSWSNYCNTHTHGQHTNWLKVLTSD